MALLGLSVSCLLAFAVAAPADIDAPTDVSGYARGADAVAFDPAAAGWADGPELQLRHRSVPNETTLGRLGAYGVLPLGALTLQGGYEWLEIPGRRYQRGSLGAALRGGDTLTLGIGYRRMRSPRPELSGINIVDLGLALRPWSWLSLSFGLDGVNAPTIDGVRQQRSLRMGAAIRPWLGEPWLTLGADTRVTREPWSVDDSRFVLDAGLNGVHALLAYSPDNETLWLGASIALFGSELRVSGVPPGGVAGSGDAVGHLASAVTLRAKPSETLLEVSGRIVEVVAAGDLLESRTDPTDSPPAIRTLSLKIDDLARDPSVDTIIVAIGKLDVGLAAIDEIRRSLHAARGAGKRVVAELSNADDKGYLLASAADRILMDPAGTLRVDGFAVSVVYFADALAKLGIRFESVEVGRYKSGPDPLTRSAPRPEDVEVQEAVLAQALRQLQRAMIEDRGLAPEHVRDLINRGAFTASEALEAGLIDELTQPSDPREMPVARSGGEPYEGDRRASPRWGRAPRIVVVPVVGTIVMRAQDNLLPGESAVAPSIVNALERARVDPNVIGVIMRVESGGGDVFASELIWRAARRAAAVKPLVASFGDVAASGGYYLAAPADVILAEADTITGSIGIFSVRPDLSGFYKLLGISPHVYKTNEHSDWNLTTHAMRPKERETMQRVLESYYDAFIERVALGRDMDEKRVRELAQGRVYTGEQALALGLVDGLGGLLEAVAEIRSRTGVSPQAEVVVDIPTRPWSVDDVLGTLSNASASLLDRWQALQERLNGVEGRALALMPVRFEVGP